MLTTGLNHLQLLFVWNINDPQNRNNDSVRLIITYCVFKHAVSDNGVMWKLNLLCNFGFLHIGALTLHASSCSKLCRLWAALCDRPSAWMTSERWRGMWSSLLMTWQDETSFRPSGQVSAPTRCLSALLYFMFQCLSVRTDFAAVRLRTSREFMFSYQKQPEDDQVTSFMWDDSLIWWVYEKI